MLKAKVRTGSRANDQRLARSFVRVDPIKAGRARNHARLQYGSGLRPRKMLIYSRTMEVLGPVIAECHLPRGR